MYDISTGGFYVVARHSLCETGQVGEDPLEKQTATQSSIPAWKIPWTEEPGGLQPMGLKRARHD